MKDSLFQTDQDFVILGHAIDVIDADRGPPEPFDAEKVFDRILLQHGPMVKMSDTKKTVTVGEQGTTAKTLQVPDNVIVFGDAKASEGQVLSYDSGSSVDHDLSVNASFSASYMGVKVSGSIDYSNSSHFKEDSQYAFQYFKHVAYTARIGDIDNFLNPAAVRDALLLPKWIPDDNLRDPAVTQAYGHWFHRYGTHVIESVDYGWNFQLQVECLKFEGSSKEKLRAFVGVEYLESKLDTTVLNSTETTEYKTNSEATPLVRGGDTTLAATYQNDPQNPEARGAWFKSVAQKPDEALIDIALKSIGDIFLDSDDPKLNEAGKQLNAALFPLRRVCRRHCIIREVNVGQCACTILSADSHIDGPTLKITQGDLTGNNKINLSRDLKSVSFNPSNPSNSNSTFEFDIIADKIPQVAVHLNLDAVPQSTFPFPFTNALVNSFFDVGRKGKNGNIEFLASTIVGLANNRDIHPGHDFAFDVKPELDYWWLPPKP